MRYEVQMFFLGAWQYRSSADSLRYAGLLAAGLEQAWSNFSARVRVLDTETGATYKHEEIR